MGPLRALAHRWSGRHLPVISEEARGRLLQGASELARDRQGCRTLRTADGSLVVKELALKRVLSSAMWTPYALRFAENAAALRHRGLGAPDVVGAWRAAAEPVHLVAYRWLQGVELRQAARGEGAGALAGRLGAFLARLHDAGALFRSCHLGNFIVGAQDGELSIIDCVDVRLASRVTPEERARSLARMIFRDEDARALVEAHRAAFLGAYFHATSAGEADRRETWMRLPGDLNEQDVSFEDLSPAG